jgi:hypothetical protein
MPLTLHSQQVHVPEIPNHRSVDIAAKINAAIELEVSRRLQERIKAAAAAQITQISRGAATGFGALFPPPPAVPLNDSSNSLRAKLIQMQQHKEHMQLLAMAGLVPVPSQGLGVMPKTNIQGAKTA